MSLVETHREQMFPVLDALQIETAKRFAGADPRSFAPGEVEPPRSWSAVVR